MSALRPVKQARIGLPAADALKFATQLSTPFATLDGAFSLTPLHLWT
jgi:hypothetical protein